MLLQEFSQLTGFTPSVDYFDTVINPTYMASKENKQDWCKAWKKNGGIQHAYDHADTERQTAQSELKDVKEWYTTTRNELYGANRELTESREALNSCECKLADAEREIRNLAHFLVNVSIAEDSSRIIRDKAIDLMGKKAYLLYKLENNFTLSVDDAIMLSAILKEDGNI